MLRADAEALWAFKRALAMQLAAGSLLGHAFVVPDRQPQRFVFSRRTARFVATEFRPGYTAQGQLDPSEGVPFRLTRNITTLLSPLLVDGVFASAMGATALAISERGPLLKPYLNLLRRDDLMSWQGSKAAPKSDAEHRAAESQLKERITKNTARVMERVTTAAPRINTTPGPGGAAPRHDHRVDHICHRLIEAAAQPERLCHMNPSFVPWL